jgi:hypothetical protein
MINILVKFSKSASPKPQIRLQSCAAGKFFLGFTQKILSLSASCIFEALSLNGQFSATFDYYYSVYILHVPSETAVLLLQNCCKNDLYMRYT